jgi:uncharacterized protein YggE
MRRTPTTLAILLGALIIAAAIALRPAGSGGGEAFAASKVSNEPGALAQYLRFSGSGDVKVKPDTADVEVGTSGQGASSSQAQNEASHKMQSVIDKLKALGISPDDLQSNVSAYPDYEHKGQWLASQSLSVTLHDPSRAGAVLAAATDAGADSVSGPSFSMSDQHAAYQQALRAAIQDARSKADAAASEMGVHVSGVVSVSDQSEPQPPVVFSAAAGVAKDSTAPAPIQQGTLDVSAQLVVVFSYAP